MSRELLEYAAKAAGIKLVWHGDTDPWCYAEISPGIKWNPLTDDGDSFRLMVRLGLDLLFTDEDVDAVATQYARAKDQEMISPWASESWTFKKQDPLAATRRAITRAAAEIGRTMKRAGAA